MDKVAARVNSQGELPPVSTRGRPGHVSQLEQSGEHTASGQPAPRPPRSFRIANTGASGRGTASAFPEHLSRSVDITDHDPSREPNRSPTRGDDPQTPSANLPAQYFDTTNGGSPAAVRGSEHRRLGQPQALSRSPPGRPRSGHADDPSRSPQVRGRANTTSGMLGYEDASPRLDAASPTPVTPGAAATPSAQQQQYFPAGSSLGEGMMSTGGGVSPTGGAHPPHQAQQIHALAAGQLSQQLSPLPPMSSFTEPPPVGAASHTPSAMQPVVVQASTSLPPVGEPTDTELPVLFGPTKDGVPSWPKDTWSDVMVGTKVTLVLGKTAAWNKSIVKMRIDRRPFAKGNIRFANHALQYSVDENGRCGPPEHVVVKRPLTGVARSKDLWDDVETQTVSAHWAEMYNSHRPPKRISFLPCWMLRIDCKDYDSAMAGNGARSQRSGKILFACEPFLPGEYVKHSNNNGWLNEAVRNTPHAFSHFTWHFSKGMLLIVDIQGVNDYYTDPQIHTPDGKGYGVGNLGYRGIEEFFLTHHCNALCKRLNLNIVQMASPDAVGATDWTVASGSVAAGSRQGKPPRTVAEGADAAASPASPDDEAAIERVA